MQGDGRKGVGTQRPLSLSACFTESRHGWEGGLLPKEDFLGGGGQPSPMACPQSARLPEVKDTAQEPECIGQGSPQGADPRGVLPARSGSGQPRGPSTDATPSPSVHLIQGLLLSLGGCLERQHPDPTAYGPLQGVQPSSSASFTEGRDLRVCFLSRNPFFGLGGP